MLAICSLLVALAFSQTSAATDTIGRLAGRVTVDGSNAPLAGAHITLMPMAPRGVPTGSPLQAVTDQDGRYTFERLAPGAYHVSVNKHEYAAARDQSSARSIHVAAGRSTADVDFRMQKGAVIAGRVLDPAGEPLAHLHVMAMREISSTGGQPHLMPATSQSQQTNDLGEFRITGVAPGEYYVAAMPRLASIFGAPGAPGAARPTGSTRTTITTTFYPGTTDPAAAQRVAVAADAEGGSIVFTMQSVPSFRVSGVVVDEKGDPVASSIVMLMGDPRRGMFMGPIGSARTQGDGRFDIDDVPAGTYQANASAMMALNSSVGGAGGGGFVIGGSVSSTFTGGVGTPIDQRTEIVVADADVKGVRVTTRRPAPRQ